MMAATFQARHCNAFCLLLLFIDLVQDLGVVSVRSTILSHDHDAYFNCSLLSGDGT